MYEYHAGIAKAVGNKTLAYGGSPTLQGGRLRFWQGATHFQTWKGQFNKVFFGTTWGEGADSGDSDTCYYGGQQGTCQPATQACAGSYGGLGCTNPGDQCCVPEQGDAGYGSCSYGGATGTCQATSDACDGYFRSGLCPGPNSVKCCLPSPYGTCSAGGKQGVCQPTSGYCAGSYKTGLCPGPNTVKCCLP